MRLRSLLEKVPDSGMLWSGITGKVCDLPFTVCYTRTMYQHVILYEHALCSHSQLNPPIAYYHVHVHVNCMQVHDVV